MDFVPVLLLLLLLIFEEESALDIGDPLSHKTSKEGGWREEMRRKGKERERRKDNKEL